MSEAREVNNDLITLQRVPHVIPESRQAERWKQSSMMSQRQADKTELTIHTSG